MREKRAFSGLLHEGWELEAMNWVAWARKPGHDSYWRFHRDRFLELLPPPGRQTLDMGCGEGRLARDLAELGYTVTGIDRSLTLLDAARGAGTAHLTAADAATLPFADHAFDLVVAFMSLQDIDDMRTAVAEAARVLELGGRLCVAVVHPLNAIGQFASGEPDSPFVIAGDYFERRVFAETAERDGLHVTFHQHHWTIEDYFRAVEASGLLVEAVREIAGDKGQWLRMPLFLHVRAVRL